MLVNNTARHPATYSAVNGVLALEQAVDLVAEQLTDWAQAGPRYLKNQKIC